MINSSFEQEIQKNGSIIYPIVGTSMMPLLRQHKDFVVIKKIDRKLKKYDVPLYKRNNGQYVLHRIIKITTNGYIIRGDNCFNNEYDITDNNIIGVLDYIVRDNKIIKKNNPRYVIYYHLWCDCYFVRKFIIKLKSLLYRIARKLKNSI